MMCNNVHMATNLALDDRLIEEARRVGQHKTKREAVSAALAEAQAAAHPRGVRYL